MDQKAPQGGVAAAFQIPRWEFIALAAALMALNALAIDIMLPGLQQIGASLGVENENHRQYVITAYFAGMAFALLAYGPASDRFGRRGPLLVGLAIYIVAAFAAAFSPSFEVLLARCASFRASAPHPPVSSPSRWCVTASAAGRWPRPCR